MKYIHHRILETQNFILRSGGAQPGDAQRILMLMYLADRECWLTLGQPLIPGPILSTNEYGPVNAHAVPLVVSGHEHRTPLPVLTRIESGILLRVITANHHLANEELLEAACELPEWSAPLYPGGDLVSLEDVLTAVGYMPEDAELMAIAHAALDWDVEAHANHNVISYAREPASALSEVA